MPWELSHKYKGAASIKKSPWKKIVQAATEGMGFQWVKLMYPIRFTAKGQNKYHLKQRSQKYIRRARSKNPNWRPLYASGEMARLSTANYKVKTRLTKGDIKCKVTLPRGHATQKYVAEEVVKVNKKEIKQLMDDFRDDIIARLQLEPTESFKKGRKTKRTKRKKKVRYKRA